MADFTQHQNQVEGPSLRDSCFSSPEQTQERLSFESTARKLLTTFLETPRDRIEEQQLFGIRLEKLRSAAGNSSFLGTGTVIDVLEPYMISLASMGKLELLGALSQRVEQVRNLPRYSDAYEGALEYALTGEILYGDLLRVRDALESTHPDFLMSKEFLSSLVRRTEEALKTFDFADLREINEFIVSIEDSFDNIGLKGQVVLATRELAEESFSRHMGNIGHTEFEQMFWLDELWKEADSQEALTDAIRNALRKESLMEAAQLSAYPLEKTRRDELREEVETVVARARARIAGGAYESLPPKDLERLHMRPLAMLSTAFEISSANS